MNKVFVYDSTASDKLSSVRGIGRYLQILKENFANEFVFASELPPTTYPLQPVFINPFFNFLQKPLTMKRVAHKQIAVIHDLIPLKYPSHFPSGIRGSIYILLNKLALRNYDLIITDSEASKSDIIKMIKIPGDKVKVIYPCLPRIFINNKSQITNNKSITNFKYQINKTTNYELLTTPYCLYVGDATWNKNLVNLARAIKIANVNCVFVGKVFQTSAVGERSGKTAEVNNGWQSELNEFLELTKDDKRFIFLGFVPDSELIKLYKQAEFNILPSRDEGFGFSYLEAAYFGCPSLLSDIPVLREISGGKAVFFDPENPQDIAEKIKNSPRVVPKKRAEFFSAEKFRDGIRSVLVSEST